MILCLFYVSFFIILDGLNCTDSNSIKDKSPLCQGQIIDQLQKQNIEFIINNKNIQVSFVISNCYSEESILFEKIQQLKITELKIYKVNSDQDFFVMQQIDDLTINKLELNNNIYQEQTLFEIKQVQNITIDSFISNNTYNDRINCDNTLNIGEFIVNLSLNGYISSLNIINIRRLELLSTNYKLSANIININKLNQTQSDGLIKADFKMLIDVCDSCYLQQLYSYQIQINEYYYTKEVNSYDLTSLQALTINKFILNDKQQFMSFSIQKYKNVTINNMEIKLLQIQIILSNIDYVRLKNIIINSQDQFQQEFISNMIRIEQCNQVVVEDIKYLSQFNNKYSIINFYLFQCNYTTFSKIYMNSVRMHNNLFYLNQIYTAIFEDIEIHTVRFNKQLIYLTKSTNIFFKKVSITNDNKDVKDYPVNFKFTDLFIKDNLFDDQKLSSNALIKYSDKEQQLQGELNIGFTEINSDFGGYNSRFFDFYVSNNQNSINIKILNSNFSNMYSDFNGGCIRAIFSLKSNKKQSIKISSSKFYNCSSYVYGGSIFTNGYLLLEDVIFEKSKSIFGGALVIYESDSLNQFKNVKFIDNYSKYYHQDVFIFWSIFEMTEYIEISEVNSNQYVIKKNIRDTVSNFKFIPGIIYVIPVTMKSIRYPLVSGENQYIVNTSEEPFFQNLYSYVDVQSSQHYFPYFLDIYQDQYKTNAYLMIKINSNPAKVTFIYKFGYISSMLHQVQSCQTGQKIIKYVSSSPDKYDCQYCTYMSASYTVNSTSCTQCDLLQFKNCYQNISDLNQGYYRQILTLDSSQIYECKYNQQSCKGGQGYGNDLCSEGHIGIECINCDITGKYWNQTFGSNGYYSCVKCNEIKYNKTLIVVILITFLAITYQIINSVIKDIKMQIQQIYLSKMNMIYLGSSFRSLGLTSVYVKIFSFNVSMLFYMQQQMSLSLKNTLLELSIQFQNPLIQSYVNLDCAISDIFTIQDNYSQIKLVVQVLLPFIGAPIIIIMLFLKYLLKQLKSQLFFYSALLSIIYLTFIAFYSPILSITLDALFCRMFQNGDKQSLLDLSVSCDKIQSNYPIAFPILIGYCLGIPLFIIISLFINRKRLYKIKILFQYGFLYKDYKEKYFYWEFIRFLVKISQIIVSKIFLFKLIYMNYVNILILVLYLTLLLIYRPFQRPQINKLEVISILINIQNFFSLIIFQSSKEEKGQQDSKSPSEIILIVSSYASLIYLLGLIFLIFYSFLGTVIIKIQKFETFQRVFSCSFCKKRIINQKRVIQNLKIFKQSAQRIIEVNKERTLELQNYSQLQDSNVRLNQNQISLLQGNIISFLSKHSSPKYNQVEKSPSLITQERYKIKFTKTKQKF